MEKKSQLSEQNFTEGKAFILFMHCCAMCKLSCTIEEYWKMKRSNAIELLKFSIEKVLKKYGKWFFKKQQIKHQEKL